MTRLRDALTAAGTHADVRVYDRGGHGFGMRHQGTSSDRWIDDLSSWLTRQGVMRVRRAQAARLFKGPPGSHE